MTRAANRERRERLLGSVTVEEALLLIDAPYERPARGPTKGRAKEVLDGLITRGLVERDPTAPRVYRCTADGEEVRKAVVGVFVWAAARAPRPCSSFSSTRRLTVGARCPSLLSVGGNEGSESV